MKWFWREIWNMSEFYGIGLGRFAPFVFMRMTGLIGARVTQVTENEKRLAIARGSECGVIKEKLIRSLGDRRSLVIDHTDEPVMAFKLLFHLYSFPCKVKK